MPGPLAVACMVRPGRHCASDGESTTGLQPGSSPGRYEKDYAFMKVIDTPRTNKIGNAVAYISPFGQCYREYCIPRNPNSLSQHRMRGIFGSSSSGWGLNLTELKREHWDATAQQVPSHPSLAQVPPISAASNSALKSTAPCAAWARRPWMNPRLWSCLPPIRSATSSRSLTRAAGCDCCSPWVRLLRTSCSLARNRAAPAG